jgi:hypothetical protein
MARIVNEMRRAEQDAQGRDEPKDRWKLSSLGVSVYGNLKQEFEAVCEKLLVGRRYLFPLVPKGATKQAYYSCLLRGLIDIEENGGVDFDEIEEKGLLMAVLERGSALYHEDQARELQGTRGSDGHEARERDERGRIALSRKADPGNQKSLPGPEGRPAPRGGSDRGFSGIFPSGTVWGLGAIDG